MNKYRTGKSESGKDEFSVPLKPDEDGMVGRECHNELCQPKYFKVGLNIPDDRPKDAPAFFQSDITCPYCGNVENMQQYNTKEQIAWITSMFMRDAMRAIQDQLGANFKTSHDSSKGMFNISLSYKPGSLPSVRQYSEQKLKQEVVCDKCTFKYAVYGISFQCPLCGEGNLVQHLTRSVAIIRVLVDESHGISQKAGEEVKQRLIDNALEDVVSLFEGFLKHVYRYSIKRLLQRDKFDEKMSKVQNQFQRLAAAEKLFKDDLNFKLFDSCKDDERDLLKEQFLKRHVLTHNLGIIDDQYLSKAQEYHKVGSEIVVKAEDVLRSLELVEKIITSAIQYFVRPDSSDKRGSK